MVRACPGAWFAGGRGWWPDGDCGSEARQNKCRVAPGSAEAWAVDPPRLGRACWALCELEYKERVWPEDPRTRVLEELRWELVQAEHQQWRCRGLWKPDALVGNKGENAPARLPSPLSQQMLCELSFCSANLHFSVCFWKIPLVQWQAATFDEKNWIAPRPSRLAQWKKAGRFLKDF